MITFNDIVSANKLISTTDIKGKEYAEVNQRVKAFRSVYPTGTIRTELINCENGVCTFRAIIENEGEILATGTAQEKESSSYINKTSYIENCETSAVGRALGFCGFGIDTSIASYEEVVNAIQQQEANKGTNLPKPTENYPEQPKSKNGLSQKNVIVLKKMTEQCAKALNASVADVLQNAYESIGVSGAAEVTDDNVEQIYDLLRKWAGVPA